MLKFTVLGSPVGYKRTTQKGCRFDKGYKRYQAYKDHVIASFLDQCSGAWGDPKPLTTEKGSKTYVSIKIYFKNYVHGDPDNVAKAINDSLFATDKFVSGSYDFDYDKENPRVEIQII